MGPLSGIRIVEFAGIGPGPFAAMLLADHGAEVIRIERPGAKAGPVPLDRSRRSIAVDCKTPEGVEVVRALCRTADGIIEGFRPGVMERLGLGPDVLIGDHSALVYGRMTGWGQTGPLAQAAGHDINYIAIAGLLDGIGPAGGPPVPPVNYLGDFGGGAMFLAFGMLAALLHARASGEGQVVDAAMTDGAAYLSSMTWAFREQGLWREQRGGNILDGGAHFYGSYACADGGHLAVGAIEPQFQRAFLQVLGLGDDPAFAAGLDHRQWPVLKARIAGVIATRSRDEWVAAFAGIDACVSPVLTMTEALAHPHHVARETFITVDGRTTPAPAPRFSVSVADPPRAPVPIGADTAAVLRDIGFDPDRIAALAKAGVIVGE